MPCGHPARNRKRADRRRDALTAAPAETWPVTIEEVAARWHCGVRWLKDIAREAGCGRRAGKAIILFEDDYLALKGSLPW